MTRSVHQFPLRPVSSKVPWKRKHWIPAYSCLVLTFCMSSRCCRTISSTTEGSASVDTSPNSSGLSWATFLKMRRIIFPDRVLGRPDTTYRGKTKTKHILKGWFTEQTQILGVLGKPNEQSSIVYVGNEFLNDINYPGSERSAQTSCLGSFNQNPDKKERKKGTQACTSAGKHALTKSQLALVFHMTILLVGKKSQHVC